MFAGSSRLSGLDVFSRGLPDGTFWARPAAGLSLPGLPVVSKTARRFRHVFATMDLDMDIVDLKALETVWQQERHQPCGSGGRKGQGQPQGKQQTKTKKHLLKRASDPAKAFHT